VELVAFLSMEMVKGELPRHRWSSSRVSLVVILTYFAYCFNVGSATNLAQEPT
jgi:hypothetical protein